MLNSGLKEFWVHPLNGYIKKKIFYEFTPFPLKATEVSSFYPFPLVSFEINTYTLPGSCVAQVQSGPRLLNFVIRIVCDDSLIRAQCKNNKGRTLFLKNNSTTLALYFILHLLLVFVYIQYWYWYLISFINFNNIFYILFEVLYLYFSIIEYSIQMNYFIL